MSSYPGVLNVLSSLQLTCSRHSPVTIHPRVKKPIGTRLAQSLWALVTGDPNVAWVGPVLSGCAVEEASDGSRTLRIKFNATMLGNDTIELSAYNKSEEASVTWALMDADVPEDADANYVYANRQPWWGDSSAWVNVDILSVDGSSILVQLPPTGTLKAIQYGRESSCSASVCRRTSDRNSFQICPPMATLNRGTTRSVAERDRSSRIRVRPNRAPSSFGTGTFRRCPFTLRSSTASVHASHRKGATSDL